MNRCDLVVHVDETLQQTQQQTLETRLQDLPGVMSAHFSHKHPHLMTVAYDCERMEAVEILGRITSQGWHAQTLGM